MKRGCVNCKYRSCSVTRAPCDNCAISGDAYSEWVAQTNADHIHNMTDEELSCFLANAYALGAIQEKCNSRAWLRWLKEEVKE